MKPILRDIPDSFETERLLLRCPKPGDGPLVYEAVQETLDGLRVYMPWASHGYSPEDAEEYVRQAQLDFLARRGMPMLILLKDTGEFIGSSGFARLNWDVPKFEIGYWCRQSQQGKGYVTEAADGLTKFAFEQLGAARVEIWCDEQNVKSKAVAERLNFRHEARLVNHSRNNAGELCNFLVYAKTSG